MHASSLSTTVAYFISPHGFGHAARSVAVMEELSRIRANQRFQIFTTVPAWFFEDSLGESFDLHSVVTDIGLIQTSSLEEDVPATVRALDEFLPFESQLITSIASKVRELDCQLVVSDISPLGLAVARAAGLPSVLVESFTWDWIYEGYLEETRELERFQPELRKLFESSDLRIQPDPCCRPEYEARHVGPVSRRFRGSRGETRRRLGIEETRAMVLLTMGGVVWKYTFSENLETEDDVVFVVPGGANQWTTRNNLLLLPHRSPIYHPDLVAAADIVVGKLGYSTLAETYHAGTPLIFVQRPRFPESPVLAAFARKHLPCAEISADAFQRGAWIDDLAALLGSERPAPVAENGAKEIARHLDHLLKS